MYPPQDGGGQTQQDGPGGNEQIQELILCAASAAAMAASEAVVRSLTEAYNIKMPIMPEKEIKEELSSKICMMNDKWGCGNFAIKGKEGWHHSKTGGWRKLCRQCKDQMSGQQKCSDQQDQCGYASDDS